MDRRGRCRRNYENAFACLDDDSELARAAIETIVKRYFKTRALVGLEEIVKRYPLDSATAESLLEEWTARDGIARIMGEDGIARWAERRTLGEIQRITVAARRRESVAVRPETFADFVARRQGIVAETILEGKVGVDRALETLRGFAATAEVWETELLPKRVRDYRASWLDELFAEGVWTWRAAATRMGDEPLAAIFPRFCRPLAGTDRLGRTLGSREND